MFNGIIRWIPTPVYNFLEGFSSASCSMATKTGPQTTRLEEITIKLASQLFQTNVLFLLLDKAATVSTKFILANKVKLISYIAITCLAYLAYGIQHIGEIPYLTHSITWLHENGERCIQVLSIIANIALFCSGFYVYAATSLIVHGVNLLSDYHYLGDRVRWVYAQISFLTYSCFQLLSSSVLWQLYAVTSIATKIYNLIHSPKTINNRKDLDRHLHTKAHFQKIQEDNIPLTVLRNHVYLNPQKEGPPTPKQEILRILEEERIQVTEEFRKNVHADFDANRIGKDHTARFDYLLPRFTIHFGLHNQSMPDYHIFNILYYHLLVLVFPVSSEDLWADYTKERIFEAVSNKFSNQALQNWAKAWAEQANMTEDEKTTFLEKVNLLESGERGSRFRTFLIKAILVDMGVLTLKQV